MADFYVWTARDLGLDIAEMDTEHQILIDKMNALYRAVEGKEGADKLQVLMDDLAQYTVRHFADEEAYMQKIGFTGLATHKIIHQQLLSQFGGYVEEFKKSRVVGPAFFNFLKVWLTSHIRGIDMKYSEFSKANKAG